MKKITRKERLRRCYFHEETDRPAVYSRTGFPIDDPSYDRLKQYLAQHTEQKFPFEGMALERTYAVETGIEKYSEDYQRKITVVRTPKGNLQSTFLEGLKGQPGLHETYLLKDRADAQKYLSLAEPDFNRDVSHFFQLLGEVGDSGIVDVGIGFNPAGSVAELFGSENFALASITYRDVVHALINRQMDIILNRVKFLLEKKVGPFFSMLGQEYITPPLHSPNDFYDFNIKYDKPIIDLIHNAGGRVHVHCHGSIKDVIEGFVDMGTDVLHPFESPPSGNITAKQAKEKARGRLCLEGNIQISSMYEWSPEQIRSYTRRLIEDVFDDNCGLIVSPTASPYIIGGGERCFSQYKAMIDTVLDHCV